MAGRRRGGLARRRRAAVRTPRRGSTRPPTTTSLDCDLLAVDEAYPAPVIDDGLRLRVHQAWRHGQVLIGQYDGRLVLAVPGTRFDAERVLDTLGRLARAVGGTPDNMAALLRIGAEKQSRH